LSVPPILRRVQKWLLIRFYSVNTVSLEFPI
jgi:hypothetical protein